MAKVRITPIDNNGRWLNISEDAAATDIDDTELSAQDAVRNFTQGRSFTIWKTERSENFVIQLHD